MNSADTNSDPLSWYYDEETSNDSDLLIVPMASDGNHLMLIPNRKNGGDKYPCSECGRCYKLKSSLFNHKKYECGKAPQFQVKYESITITFHYEDIFDF